ncbi:hypothetical protein AGMMS49938_06270 [Fibrobacterales bacterium]|nr:hypothetical protein AGMMS49938_06270 [Fibrobacterales bacterium]
MDHSNESDIEQKRIKSLFSTFISLVSIGLINSREYTINRSLMSNVVRHYLQDRTVMKVRYGIKGRIQAPKVAGLIAASVMRYKPVLPINGNAEHIESSDANELLAVLHGLAVCAELPNGKIDSESMRRFITDSRFKQWLYNLKHLLHYRNYTPGSLYIIFDTASRLIFPNYETESVD